MGGVIKDILYNCRNPSVADIRLKAFQIPVYITAGDAVNTCIRVCGKENES